jgi:hypothetical protein
MSESSENLVSIDTKYSWKQFSPLVNRPEGLLDLYALQMASLSTGNRGGPNAAWHSDRKASKKSSSGWRE